MSLGAATLVASGIAAPMVAEREGFIEVGYIDIAGVRTRCLGSTSGVIVIGQRYTTQQCMDLFVADLVKHGRAIESCVKVPVSPYTRAAFISFSYNLGVANFCQSTMARKLNAGDLAGACAELPKWNKARVNGQLVPVRGLTLRRAEERQYCERGLHDT